jgi:hypothetical protein
MVEEERQRMMKKWEKNVGEKTNNYEKTFFDKKFCHLIGILDW